MRTRSTSFTGQLTNPAVQVLMDLLENKLSCMDVYDREDARELRTLERARAELLAFVGKPVPAPAQPMHEIRSHA